jgi:NAD(P)H-quinone oxidoreductase subunit 4L
MTTLVIALVVGAGLFGIGLYGSLSQTNLVMIMMGIELMLGAALLNLVAFWRFLHPQVYAGQMFVLIVLTVMAVEMAVGFAVATARFRAKGSVEMEEAEELNG